MYEFALIGPPPVSAGGEGVWVNFKLDKFKFIYFFNYSKISKFDFIYLSIWLTA